MSINTLLRVARLLSVGAGTGLATFSQATMLGSVLTGPGSNVSMLESGSIQIELLKSAAPVPTEPFLSGGSQLVMGIGFLVIGFLLHALIAERQEREVHITVAPPKKRPAAQPKWFWIEMRI